MDHTEICELMRRSAFASELSDGDCEVLASIAMPRVLADDETLLKEGDQDNALHIVVAGRIAVCRRSGGDEWVTLQILSEGDMAGELGFIDGTRHCATLRSLGESRVVSLERERFESLIEQHPLVVYRVMRAIVRTVHVILRRMNSQYVEMSNYIGKSHGCC